MEPTTIAFVGIGLYLLRGKTGELELFGPDDLPKIAETICNALPPDVTLQTPRAVALAVATEAYPDFTWPPRPLATASHKAVWMQISQWADQLFLDAAEAGVLDVCEYLTAADTPAPPPIGIPDAKQPPHLDPLAGKPVLAPTPTPGRWYEVGTDPSLKGKGHLRHVGKAYGLSAGTNARARAARGVNADPRNEETATYRPCVYQPGNPLHCSLTYDTNRVISYQDGNMVYFPLAPDGGW